MPKRRFEAVVSDPEPVVTHFTENGEVAKTWNDFGQWFKKHIEQVREEWWNVGKFPFVDYKKRKYWDTRPKDNEYNFIINSYPEFMQRPLQKFGPHSFTFGYNSYGIALRPNSFNGKEFSPTEDKSPFKEQRWSAITEDNEIGDGYVRRKRFLSVSFIDNMQDCLVEIAEKDTSEVLYTMIPTKWKEGSSTFTVNLDLLRRIVLDYAGVRVSSTYHFVTHELDRQILIIEDLYGRLTTFEDHASINNAKVFLKDYFNMVDFIVKDVE